MAVGLGGLKKVESGKLKVGLPWPRFVSLS